MSLLFHNPEPAILQGALGAVQHRQQVLCKCKLGAYLNVPLYGLSSRFWWEKIAVHATVAEVN